MHAMRSLLRPPFISLQIKFIAVVLIYSAGLHVRTQGCFHRKYLSSRGQLRPEDRDGSPMHRRKRQDQRPDGIFNGQHGSEK